jgi:hypothetical protein
MSDWSEPLLLARKRLATVEACCTLHMWRDAAAAISTVHELLQGIQSAILLQESEHTRLKYERGGWVLHNLKEYDVVAKKGVCGYCGSKTEEHAEGCAMWSAA